MGSTIVRGRYVITGVDGAGEPGVIEDGALVQRDGVIVDLGRYADVAARHRADVTLGSARHVVIPGLVNGHHHVGLTPLQLGSPDLPLELWLASRIAPRDVDPHLDPRYSALE